MIALVPARAAASHLAAVPAAVVVGVGLLRGRVRVRVRVGVGG